MNRNLSGIYFREQNSKGEFENVCFEDCNSDKQSEILDKATHEFAKNLCLQLARIIKRIGDELDIVAE